MAEVRDPAGPGFKILTVLGVVFFLVVVAVLIRSSDDNDSNDSNVAAVGPPVTAVAPSVDRPQIDTAPVGGVATGGGGMAARSGDLVVPVLAGLAALTMVTAGGMVLRRREA